MLFLKDKNNSVWEFFIDENNNLCYKKTNEDINILQNNCTNEFDCCFDKAGMIHVVVQKVNGELCYFKYDYKKWQKFLILKSKFAKQSFSNVSVCYLNEQIELFYILFYENKHHIVHHKINPENQQIPVILDYCCERNFSVAYENLETHVIYKNESNQLIDKICKSRSYTDNILSLDSSINEYCSIILNGSLHIVYVLRLKTHYTLVYEDINKKLKRTLGFGTDSVCKPYMFFSNNILDIIWSERYNSYRVKLNILNNSFSKIEFLGKNSHLVKVKDFNFPNRLNYIIKEH